LTGKIVEQLYSVFAWVFAVAFALVIVLGDDDEN
jgi:hypothetical protein